MISALRRYKQFLSLFFVWLIAFQIVPVEGALALTSGPTQPEVQGFQPAGTTEMVDLFSGDFVYNIPLFELPGPNGGYPFNLSYQAGITMDQEASWVGLGWGLQPGSINRQMRGLPDEFNGDLISSKMSINPNVTVGMGLGATIELFGGDALSLGVGLSVYQNNYKGMGYSVDGTLSFAKSSATGMTGGLSLGLSLDSKEGVGVNPSLSLGGEIGEFGLGASYNSKQGLSNISLSTSMNYNLNGKDKNGEDKSVKTSFHSSSNLSLAHPGYTPQISMPMKNINLSATFKAGGAWWGAFGAPYITGFYNEQWLDNNNKWTTAEGFGYMNYQFAQTPFVPKAMLDFNREKDGMVSKETPNLGMPSLTYDIYSVTGQGIGMMYRPMRNDAGMVYDQEVSSVSNSVGVGVDVGPAASHVGVNLSVNHSKSTSGRWSDNNQLLTSTTFQKKSPNYLFEPYYFKVHGESTTESDSRLASIGDEKPVRVRLTSTNNNLTVNATPVLENKSISKNISPNNSLTQERSSRNQNIQPITNAELINSSGAEMISHFKVSYLDSTNTEKVFNRSLLPKHHMAGYSALTADGLQYIYGIPAYNLEQEEVTFSVNKQIGQVSRVSTGDLGNGDPKYDHEGTDKFLRRMKLPKYAHSYLLTSILGPDYVDVTNDGVTEDDLGYWVKFTYQKITDDFKWRDPYSQAHFQEGWKTDYRDDKGNFVYGRKEIWYLSKAETKSHIALFVLDSTPRKDGMGVLKKLQNSDAERGKSVFSLKEIKLFTRASYIANPTNPNLIKITKFEYDYTLCGNVFNNDGSAAGIDPITGLDRNLNKGKLTLRKVWFEYGGSTRGRLNPYNFKYNDSNPGYDILKYDRWGNYKPYPGGEVYYNNDFPYSEQNPASKTQIDNNAAAWSLKEIILPSGGKIIVDYETDDYAYVQNKTAMQMTAIVDPYTSPNGTLNNNYQIKQNNRKVRFKLESPISGTLSTPQQKDTVLKYIDTQTWQLYFKMKVNLKKPDPNAIAYEYISGYADINKDSAMILEKDGSGKYVFGSFYLKSEDGKHPFSMRAWQHLRTNQPELANSNDNLKQEPNLEQTSNTSDRINQIKSLKGNIFTQISQMFKGFNNYCDDKNWGKQIDASKSWVRLNSPDKRKYGGGLRVKQITMKDNWNAQDHEGIYGQIYEYTLQEGSQKISSGVATYEPIIGGDENALRYAKKYVQSVPLRSDNNLFFEYPINESNYPGPQVGYRNVTVMSLASAALASKSLSNTTLSEPGGDGQPLFPTGANVSYGTTGKTIHEFYTAKEFPVITDETERKKMPYQFSAPIPLLGTISIMKLAVSQGYSIITNDMHGKLKKVSNYRQDKTGKFEPEPISWVKYNYLSEQKVINKEKVSALINTLKENDDETLSVIEPNDGSVSKYFLGQENEFFYDMRQYRDDTFGGGVRLNTDILYIPLIFAVVPIPVPTVWPNIGSSTNQVQIAVTNKIIFKSGILESVEAFDGGSLIKTKNLKWDKLTGNVVLSSVNNNFDLPVYSYSIPAFREYQGMGAAYQNIGLSFEMSSVQPDPYKPELYQFYSPLTDGTLTPGDELLLYPANESEYPVAKAVYTGNNEGDDIFYCEGTLTSTSYNALIVRSGFRNQLSVIAGTVTALQDPTLPGTEYTYQKQISVPKSN